MPEMALPPLFILYARPGIDSPGNQHATVPLTPTAGLPDRAVSSTKKSLLLDGVTYSVSPGRAFHLFPPYVTDILADTRSTFHRVRPSLFRPLA